MIQDRDANQLARWNLFINSWKAASRISDVTVIGDLNLDFQRWGAPSIRVEKMVDKVKTDIETLGFHQIVEEVTRSWPDQPDSLLDHIWMNSPPKTNLLQKCQKDSLRSQHYLDVSQDEGENCK